ncbi:MAG TPA: ATP-grasp domain-containing protein [Gallionellaceae bacterium]
MSPDRATMTSFQPDYQRVLVTGVGGPSGKAATTALRQRGFFVLGVDMNMVPNEADQFAQVPASVNASYPEMLRHLIREHRIGWLFPTVAEELVSVAELAAHLRAQGVAVFISDPSAVSICHDKWETARALHARGVAVPASAVGSAGSPSVRALGFPAVSRPRSGRGGRGVVVHDGPGIAPAVAEPIWQEFMSGTEYDVLCVRHPDASEDIIMCQVFEKTALKDGRVGNAVEVKAVEVPDVAALAKSAARALSLTGPLDMDIRRGQDGAPRLLEINARIGAHALKAPALFDVLVDMVQQGHRG